MSNELSKVQQEEQYLADLGYDETDAGGGGLQDRTADDMKIPFLALLQSQSPQIVDAQRKIDGAEVGMLCDSVTSTLYGDHILFVPGAREIVWVEWKKRDEGGGFIARHATDSPLVASLNLGRNDIMAETPDGHDLKKTVYLWGIRVDEEAGTTYPMIVAFDVTKLKVYQAWRMAIDMFTVGERKWNPDIWCHYLRIGSKQERNKKGQLYQNFVIEPVKGPGKMLESLLRKDDPRRIEAEKIGRMALSGELRPDEESRASAGHEDDSDSPF